MLIVDNFNFHETGCRKIDDIDYRFFVTIEDLTERNENLENFLNSVNLKVIHMNIDLI
jgi:hypothetical protein